jgi:hypothetical protein
MLRFTVHVHPGARSANVGGDYGGALNVHVRSRAVEGAATSEVLDALARAFGVRTKEVRLVRGAHSRDKVVEIEGDVASLRIRLEELLGT